jgi:hypothetical protein
LAILTELLAVTKELKDMKFVQSSGRNKISSTNTDHGYSIFTNLKENHRVHVVDVLEGPSVLSSELINQARALREMERPRIHEKVLVSLYTPELMKLIGELDPRLSLVNSEYFQWLHCSSGHSSSDMKPDLFTAHHSLVTFAPPYLNAPECTESRHFGKFLNWGCRASIHCIWDCKWKIDIEAFGQKVKYLQITGEDSYNHNKKPLWLKGILFDMEEFWMIRSAGEIILDLQRCKLDQNGSRKVMMDFLQVNDPWIEATEALCATWDVTIPDYHTKVFTADDKEPISAILGAGAHGRVLKLENDARVMKVVVGDASDAVELEYKMMLKMSGIAELSSAVFPVVNNTFVSGLTSEDVKYTGYLLAAEGERIRLPISVTNLQKLATSLVQLHIASVPHGDPRIDNALLHEGLVKWIDFRATQSIATTMNKTNDVKILLRSLDKFVPVESALIAEYVKAPTVEKLLEILMM